MTDGLAVSLTLLFLHITKAMLTFFYLKKTTYAMLENKEALEGVFYAQGNEANRLCRA
jgi:hypothetical protein